MKIKNIIDTIEPGNLIRHLYSFFIIIFFLLFAWETRQVTSIISFKITISLPGNLIRCKKSQS